MNRINLIKQFCNQARNFTGAWQASSYILWLYSLSATSIGPNLKLLDDLQNLLRQRYDYIQLRLKDKNPNESN